MTRRNALLHQCRAGGQCQRRLGDVIGRARQDTQAKLLQLFFAGRRPDQHAVAARALHFLDHQLSEVIQRVLQLVRLAQLIGGHVAEDGLFVQIKPYHGRYVNVGGLVIRHAGAHGVSQRDAAVAVDRHQAGHAQHGIRLEAERIQIFIVYAAVDHVHAPGAFSGAHVDIIAAHEQVLSLYQLHAHLLGDEGMLKIGAVVGSRRQQYHRRFLHAGWGKRAQIVQQHLRIVLDRCHRIVAEQFGEQPHHHFAVFQHVGHAGRRAQIVFQHVKLILAGTHDIYAGDVRVDAARHRYPYHLRPVLAVGEDAGRYDTGLDDVLAVVNVMQKHVQRLDALNGTSR